MWLYLALEPKWAGETELPVRLPARNPGAFLAAGTPGAVRVVFTSLFISAVIRSEQFKAIFRGAAAAAAAKKKRPSRRFFISAPAPGTSMEG